MEILRVYLILSALYIFKLFKEEEIWIRDGIVRGKNNWKIKSYIGTFKFYVKVQRNFHFFVKWILINNKEDLRFTTLCYYVEYFFFYLSLSLFQVSITSVTVIDSRASW